MSILGNDSTSKTSSTNQGVSDQGILLVSGKGSNLLNSILLSGKGSSYNTGLSGTATASWGGKVNQNITVNDLDQVKGVLEKIGATQNEGVSRIANILSTSNEEAQQKLSELAKNVQTGGQSDRDNSILWVIGFFVVGIAAALFFWRPNG